MVGIDISGFQPDDVPGHWEFIVVKSTEGNWLANKRADAQWAHAARTTRGLYHYARPALSSGQSQANTFANDALARGFKPGVDLWQLDAEDGENPGVAAKVWQTFIDAFMVVATARLGPRGFLYAGWPFVEAHGLTNHIRRWKWWLPDYGRNDGAVHPFGNGVPSEWVVIHQYTSVPNLDQNVIVNATAYAPPVALAGKVKPMFNPPLAMLPWVAAWKDAEGNVVAAVADNGDVYAFGVPYRPWPTKATDFAGRHAAQIGPMPGDPSRYQITATSGETYEP